MTPLLPSPNIMFFFIILELERRDLGFHFLYLSQFSPGIKGLLEVSLSSKDLTVKFQGYFPSLVGCHFFPLP
jgi:hypothetical protein